MPHGGIPKRPTGRPCPTCPSCATRSPTGLADPQCVSCPQDGGSEGGEYESEGEETASPTIPALRTAASPFHAPAGPAPPPLPVPPRAKALLGLSPAPSGEAPAPALPPLARAAQLGGGAQAGAVPRLALTHSMHSNLELRNASAELQARGWKGQARHEGRGADGMC